MIKKLRLAAPIAATLLASSAVSFAQAPPPPAWEGRPSPLDGPPQPEVETVKRWYGWQTLIGVGASDVLLIGGFISGASDGGDGFSPLTIGVMGLGLAGHTLSGPIIHWAHGSVGTGFISLGMNLLLPGCGMGLGYAGGAATDRPVEGFIAGTLTGMLVAQVLDVALLSYKNVPVRPPGEAQGDWVRSLTIAPLYGPNGAGVRVAGLF